MISMQIIFLLFLSANVYAGPRKKVNKDDGKIVGGTETQITQVPYQVSLQKRNYHICGGAIIGSKHILTAAHCITDTHPRDLSVRVGSTQQASGGTVYKVVKATAHHDYDDVTSDSDIAVLELDTPIRTSSGAKIMPWKNKYRGKRFDNDIAVLKLETPLKFSKKVKAIGMARTEPSPGELATVSGWGATRHGGSTSATLLSVIVPVISRQSCQRMYIDYNTVTNNMWCAGFQAGGKDSCQGDSGGPAVVKGKLAGVVSWGSGCAKRKAPGVYTSVSKFYNWILRQMSPK